MATHKPNFQQLADRMSRVSAYKKALEDILSTEEETRRRLQMAAVALYKRESQEALKKVPAERLSLAEHDLPIGPLKEAGYTNVYQIRTATYGEIQKIEGVETKDMAKIFDAAVEIEESMRSSQFIRLDIDSKDPMQDEMVFSLYRYIYLQDVYQGCRDLKGRHKIALEDSLGKAGKIRTSLDWFFASKTAKEEVSNADDILAGALTSDLPARTNSLLNQYRLVQLKTKEDAWADFAGKPAVYYAKLEEYLENYQIETVTSVTGSKLPEIPSRRQSKSAKPLPAALAEEVEKVELDLTGLNATLRGYQKFGVQYLLQQEKVLLGDEMGLGKTMQALAGMVHLRNHGASHFLVVCPASVLINWMREVAKFTDIKPFLLHGKDIREAAEAWRMEGGIGVTNYESMAKLWKDETPDDDIDNSAFAGLKLSMLVVDEAHFIKNPQAKRTDNVRRLLPSAERVIFMTGTPLENNVKEMRNLIGMLDSELSSSLPTDSKKFEKEACIVYLRRLRGDVLQELPEKVESEEWVNLNFAEKRSYSMDVIAGNFMGMRQVSWNTKDIKDSSKAERLKELVELAKEEKRKVIVFSFFLNTLAKVCEVLGDDCLGPITGSVPSDQRQKIIDEFTQSENKTVLACQAISGGTGLNIQAASVIIFCEPQIKPSIENQAISRAYRMGQIHKVLVYRLLADNTIDERIMEILENKQEIFDTYAERSSVGEANVLKLKQISQEEIIQKEREQLSQEEEK